MPQLNVQELTEFRICLEIAQYGTTMPEYV